ncbi:MAG: hypothetical protein ACYDGR_06070 [Candidatus Dormibacteria bacterium]
MVDDRGAHRVPRLLLGGIALSLALVLGSPGVSFPARAAGGNALGFGLPTVVDHFRVGFEPTVAQDPQTGSRVYESVPTGFSTTQTFVWRSDDRGRTFNLVPGNVSGKSTNCVGGGDTEVRVDPVNSALYLVDLQGLTNFSTSVSTDAGATWTFTCNGVNGVGVDRQWTAIDSNGKTAAVGPGAGGGRIYLDYDNIFQAGTTLHNQLVMNESIDGYHYGGLCDTGTASVPCPGTPAVISADEGILGPVAVDNGPGNRFQHSIYAAHTSADSASFEVAICRGAPGDNTADKVANSCTDPTRFNPSDPLRVSTLWHDVYVTKGASQSVGNLFPVISIDPAGNLYAAWSQLAKAGSPSSIYYSRSTDGGEHWSPPVHVAVPGVQSNVQPWIAAGDPGRVDIVWYGSTTAKEGSQFASDYLTKALWNVYMAQSINALDPSPQFAAARVTDHNIKYGTVSTGGLTGGADRSLGDYLQVQAGPRGEAEISFVDDTSGDRNVDVSGGTGETPSEAAGPPQFVAQTGGPSLQSSVGDLGPAPPNPVNHGRNLGPHGGFAAAGTTTAAPPHLQVETADVSLADPTHIRVTMHTLDSNLAANLGPDPSLGGTSNEWVVSWVEPDPKGQGDGNIFYAAMESDGGGAPTFFDGSTGAIFSSHAKFFTYQADHAIQGSIKGGDITWLVPTADVGNTGNGSTLYTVTGFTSTLAGPTQPVQPSAISQRSDVGPLANFIDSTESFTGVLGAGVVSTATPTPVPAPAATPSATPPLPNTGAARSQGIMPLLLVLVASGAVPALRLKRRRRSP